jgi:hypothetical protein
MSDLIQGIINIIKSGLIVSTKKIKTAITPKNSQPHDKHHH